MKRFFAWLFGRPKPELVRYRDSDTGQTVLIPKAELRPGVVLVRVAGEAEAFYIDAAQLKQGGYQHSHFEGEARDAIQSLVAKLAEVYPKSYEQWEDGFRRDRDPEREIAGWLHLADILAVMTSRFALEPAEKKECFKILVACFTGSRETVRDRSDPKLLPVSQVELAIKYFFEGGYG